MLRCVEVFLKLKNKRNFKGILLFFDNKEFSLEIDFNSDNEKLNKDIAEYYGFGNSLNEWGVKFGIFVNGIELEETSSDTNFFKNKNKLKIFYNDEGCFLVYSHLIVYEIDNNHDNDYFLRKELEKWSI